jgi:hypothetical protein
MKLTGPASRQFEEGLEQMKNQSWSSLIPLAACLVFVGCGDNSSGRAQRSVETATPGEPVARREQLALAPIEFDGPVRLKAGDEFIDTAKDIAHAGPLAVDLDADGKLDLLVGNFRGHFQVYMNTGTRAEPEYEDKGLLEADGETAKVPNW